MGPVKYSWDKIVRLEETRKSFVIITSKGNISAGWIDPSRRDLLMRKVLELAKLTYVAEPPRWGIKAVYVTRLKPIKVEFAPKADASEKK